MTKTYIGWLYRYPGYNNHVTFQPKRLAGKRKTCKTFAHPTEALKWLDAQYGVVHFEETPLGLRVFTQE